jgi:hypothetical protein
MPIAGEIEADGVDDALDVGRGQLLGAVRIVPIGDGGRSAIGTMSMEAMGCPVWMRAIAPGYEPVEDPVMGGAERFLIGVPFNLSISISMYLLIL